MFPALLLVAFACDANHTLQFVDGSLTLERVGYSDGSNATAWTDTAGEPLTHDDRLRLSAIQNAADPDVRIHFAYRWDGDLSTTVPLSVATPTRPTQSGDLVARSDVTPRTKTGFVATGPPAKGRSVVIEATAPVGRWKLLQKFPADKSEAVHREFAPGRPVSFLGRFFDDAGRSTCIFTHGLADREVRIIGEDAAGQTITADVSTRSHGTHGHAVARFTLDDVDQLTSVRLETRTLETKAFPPHQLPAFAR